MKEKDVIEFSRCDGPKILVGVLTPKRNEQLFVFGTVREARAFVLEKEAQGWRCAWVDRVDPGPGGT